MLDTLGPARAAKSLRVRTFLGYVLTPDMAPETWIVFRHGRFGPGKARHSIGSNGNFTIRSTAATGEFLPCIRPARAHNRVLVSLAISHDSLILTKRVNAMDRVDPLRDLLVLVRKLTNEKKPRALSQLELGIGHTGIF